MLPDKNNNWWKLYVNPLLQTFIANNIPTSLRWKAFSIMSKVYLESGGFNNSTNMTARDIAASFGVTDTNITNALKVLEELGIIRRDPAGEKGNPLYITPLSPENWELPDGQKFVGVGGVEHFNEPVSDEKFNNLIDLKHDNNVTNEFMQDGYDLIFNKIISYIEGPNELTATDPSKLLGLMAVVLKNTDKFGESCRLNQKEIGEIMTQNNASVGKILKKLEVIGVIKRVRGQGRNFITALVPIKNEGDK